MSPDIIPVKDDTPALATEQQVVPPEPLQPPQESTEEVGVSPAEPAHSTPEYPALENPTQENPKTKPARKLRPYLRERWIVAPQSPATQFAPTTPNIKPGKVLHQAKD